MTGFRRIGAAIFLSAAAAACAQPLENKGDGGAGGAGGASTGSQGGDGGAGGGTGLCAVDCSTIETAACYQAVCNEGQLPGAVGACIVVASEAGTECDDGLFCTVDDSCLGGECVGGPPNDCGQTGDVCTKVVCNEASASCSTAPANEGSFCSSSDLCKVNAKCQSGACVGSLKDCSFSPAVECQTSVCQAATGLCEPVPDPTKNGQACAASGDPCMLNKTCSVGQCLGGVPKDCSDLTSACHTGSCDVATGACFADADADGVACSDGNACTAGDLCSAGSCVGTAIPQHQVYFAETFESNAAGWTMGPGWEIAPAKASAGHNYGHGDPALDHSLVGDGVGGVVIGGNAAKQLHDYRYLTSPAFDTASAAGGVHLEYWRWLNSDQAPFMVNRVDVFDGATWVTLWTSETAAVGVADKAWTPMSHDVTAYKNASMRVRFGFKVGSALVRTVSGWNVDDVVVGSMTCIGSGT